MSQRPEDKYLDTHELENLIDQLDTKIRANPKDTAAIAERDRLAVSLKNTIQKAIDAANGTVKALEKDVDSVPKHQKEIVKEELAAAKVVHEKLVEKQTSASKYFP
jgi:hypothetical protein